MAEAVNVWNEAAIETYLKNEIAHGEQPLGDYLVVALGRALRKPDGKTGHLKRAPFDALPVDAPQWMQQKFPNGGAFEEFTSTPELERTVRHIADWIKGAIVSQETWLQDKDDKGRPVRLREIGSIERATHYANEAMQRLRLRTLVEEEPGDIDEIRTWPDGYRIVRLLTPSALDRESQQMGHCIGNGAYDGKVVKAASHAYYSLRDPLNKSHATFEVEVGPHALRQCKGKENKPPVRRYMPYIQDFLKEQKWMLDEAASHTGLIQDGERYFSIYDLPRDFSISNLNLNGCTGVTSLPDNLSVEGSLNLNGCTGLTWLPDKLSVGRKLHLSGCTGLTSLPDNLSIGGTLDLYGCTGLTSLPDNLIVENDLYLTGCTGLTSLPEKLVLGKNLYLTHCTGIKSLPEKLSVKENLDLSHCTGLTSLPNDIRVTENLFLAGCTGLTSLPGNLSVGEDLNLWGCTGLTSLPDDLRIGGNFNLTDCTGVSSLPDNLSVGEALNLSGCTDLTSLPDNLSVGGDLDLSGCPHIVSLPKDLHVAGKIVGFTGHRNAIAATPATTRARS